LDRYEGRRYRRDHFSRYAERRLKLDYAIARFAKSEVALKTRDQDPQAWFTVKRIPERSQLAVHLRVPVRDELNNLTDHLDLDIYFQEGQVAEMIELLAQPHRRVNRVG